MWFKSLVGFDEKSPEYVRENLHIDGNKLVSKANNKSYQFGALEILTLAELRTQAPPLEQFKSKIALGQIVEDVGLLHQKLENKDALFQVASQFNLLEMLHPDISPEMGVDRYEEDFTQGPVCAIACGAGTIYRNYFLEVNGQTGQSSNNQVDCLRKVGEILKNSEQNLWEMRNGYALVQQEGLLKINALLANLSPDERELLKNELQIGVQWNTAVTISDQQQLVSQAYCSALPVAYSGLGPFYWEKFAKLVLEAAYEATFYAALINRKKTGSNKVFLTLLGGGAFGNELDWITSSILKTLLKFKDTPLDVSIVSFKKPNPAVNNLIQQFQELAR